MGNMVEETDGVDRLDLSCRPGGNVGKNHRVGIHMEPQSSFRMVDSGSELAGNNLL